MRAVLFPALLALAVGCGSNPPLSKEAVLERYQSSPEEYDEIKRCLTSGDVKEIHRGLNMIQKNPVSFQMYREEVTYLNQTSSDQSVVRATTDLLSRF